jgi:hypothetical protein
VAGEEPVASATAESADLDAAAGEAETEDAEEIDSVSTSSI